MSSQPTSTVPWIVYSDTTNEVIVSGELEHQSELSTLAQYAQGRQVTVLTNGADVRLHCHYMATKPSRQIIKALPYMLEDELAEDIDALHIATEDMGFDKALNKHWLNIAIVSKSLIKTWLDALNDAGIPVKRIIPESLCLPFEQKTDAPLITTLQIGNGWIFRENVWQGTFVESQWLPIYVARLVANNANAAENSNEGKDGVADIDGSEADSSILTLKPFTPLPEDVIAELALNANIELSDPEPELPMLVLAKGAEQVKWNLLQGDLAPKKQISKNWQIWSTVGVMALVIFFLEIVAKGVSWHNKSQELVAKKAELVTMYQAAFPKEKVRVALLKRQLTKKVADVSGGVVADNSGYLQLMLKLTPVLQKHSSVIAESFRFEASRGELRISASAPTFQKFEQFRIGLEQLGLDVKQGAVSNEGNLVSGTINVKEVE
ncbi:type II secretion system protein GspL [Psychrosphaera sp. 1_MG-2023]|uniref:type II secretion system protein GspL n=1 Tax=Psychrosphaera sp. 1_MG-2023 TaxID=3062643 RepID=UPI0026E1345F|nr:type II secretion system protein GspL [Psychrosphaera sp. 1_MG-2023]MDO6720448.1 type II secretion system protein GspL [Psychrosphaera sp. 1_MG-2023]